MIDAYPLHWPDNWPRTPQKQRLANNAWKFGFGKYLTHLLEELRRLRAARVIVSSNLRLRRDGLPAADQREPGDAGVAVYFTLDERPLCFACDKYRETRLNVHAIGLTIEALRTIERNGASQMMERAFRGFAALPEKAGQHWRDVLDLHGDPVTADAVEAQFRRLAKQHHPDTGGDAEHFRLVVRARIEALQAIHAATNGGA